MDMTERWTAVGAGLMAASLVACTGGEDLPERARQAADAVDESLFEELDYEIELGDDEIKGKLDELHWFELVLDPDADTEAAGENLETLLNDYGIMPTVHLPNGGEVGPGSRVTIGGEWRDIIDAEQYADLLELGLATEGDVITWKGSRASETELGITVQRDDLQRESPR